MLYFLRHVLLGTSIFVSISFIKKIDPIIFLPFFVLQIGIFSEFIFMLFAKMYRIVTIHFFYIYLLYISIIHLFLHPEFFLSYYTTLYFLFLSFLTYDMDDKERVEKITKFLETCPDCLDISLECYICLENSIETTKALKTLPCSHNFHKDCLVKWFESSTQQISSTFTCPVCRQNILAEDDQNENC